jgi:hypothetical protein
MTNAARYSLRSESNNMKDELFIVGIGTPRKVLTPLYINLKQIPLAAKALAHNVSANSELIDTHEDAAGRSDRMRYDADNYTLSVL